MKTIFFTLLILLLININISPQEKDNYFPHAVGNVWQYLYDDGTFFQERIIRDSVDSFGNTFLHYGTGLPNFYWSYRVTAKRDSIFLFPFTYNELEYKFPLDSGEVFERDTANIYYAKVNDTFNTVVLGRLTEAITLSYYGGHPDSFYTEWENTRIMANHFGKVWYGDEVSYYNLVGCVIDGDTLGFIVSGIEVNNEDLKLSNFSLSQNYPNPFNPATIISFELIKRQHIKLEVHNLLGEEVKVLAEGEFPTGNYKVSFNASGLPAGIYFYSLISNNQRQTKKMIYLK